MRDEKGRIITRIDPQTGQVLCLVEKEAEYGYAKKMIIHPATAEKIEIPPQYVTVQKKIMVEPASVEKIVIPAEYKDITVLELVKEAERHFVDIPERTNTVQVQMPTNNIGKAYWGKVFCEKNFPPEKVRELQEMLGEHYTGRGGKVDGIYQRITRAAVDAYQKEHNLIRGGLTVETLKHLGIEGFWNEDRE